MRTAVRLLAGAVFVVFGAGKFVNHGAELASFQTYGLPVPEVFVIAVGLLELVGGIALIVGWRTRLWAVALAGDMVGAIIVSGFGKGELISLTLAPVLLAAMIGLLWRPGPSRGPPAAGRPPTPNSHSSH